MTTADVEYSVATLWRYPVKSMQGEELNAADITGVGLLGDRRFAVIDPATGKVAGAKNPRKWPCSRVSTDTKCGGRDHTGRF